MHSKINSLTSHLLNHWIFGLKLTMLSVCLFAAFSGDYPPAHAQRYQIVAVPVVTTEDAMQDDHIGAINKHLQSTDDTVKALQDSNARLRSEIDYLHGEERIIGGVLALLTAGGLFLQFKQQKV